jgi:hypothetical protein
MESKLLTVRQTSDLIKQNRLLVIAAAEVLLAQLPDGNWLGGSNPYLLGTEGGMYSEDMLYVKDFTDLAPDHKVCIYDKANIHRVTKDAFENSLIVVVFPAFSEVLQEFAVKSPEFENQYINPLLGWVSGLAFEKMGMESPTVYWGARRFTDKAIALHIKLPNEKVGRIEIVNLYEPGDGDEISFEHDGFNIKDCHINGQRMDFYTYMHERNDLYLPLVADYTGAKINVAVLIDHVNKKVKFFAPVFKNTIYKIAKKAKSDYINYLTERLKQEKNSQLEYSYSCLYNYFNFQLENKPIAGFVGTFTFGEIAYQLLNVTFVYLLIEDKEKHS